MYKKMENEMETRFMDVLYCVTGAPLQDCGAQAMSDRQRQTATTSRKLVFSSHRSRACGVLTCSTLRLQAHGAVHAECKIQHGNLVASY